MDAATRTASDVRAPEPVRLVGWSVLGLAVAVVRNGIWGTPNLAFFSAISTHLGSNPFPKGLDGDYLLTNLTGPTVARALGQTDPHAYARLHLVLLVVGLGLVVAATHRRFGYRTARALVLILAASPAVTVCLQWLGQPDALTLPLAMGLVLARRRWTAFAVAVVLGLTHAEQGIVAAVIATLASPLLPRSGSTTQDVPDGRPGGREAGRGEAVLQDAIVRLAQRGLVLVGGVVVGRGITEVYLRTSDIRISRPRTSFLCLGVRGFWDFHTQAPVSFAYALWGPLWLLLGWLGWRWWHHRRGPWPAIVALAALGVLPVLVTLDETRVYSLVTAPLLVLLAVAVAAESPPERLVGRTRTAAAVVGLVALAAVPGGFTAGEAYWAPALHPIEFARFLVDGHVPGGAGQTSAWLLQPFGFTPPPRC
jgi:hypothetical protein